MIYYLDQREVPDGENIPSQVLTWLVRKAETQQGRLNRLWRYYLGQHDVFCRKRREEEVPVAVNYAKYVVDTVLGYYLGNPVKYDGNPTDDQGRVQQLGWLQRCYDRMHADEIDAAIGKTMGVLGECLELCYADGAGMPRSARIDPRNGILVCDTTVEHKKLFALIWERRERPGGERYYFVTVYTPSSVQEFISGDLRGESFAPAGEKREHWFGDVPVIAYTNNEERQGDFEQILSLIDAYDELMTSRLTDKRKFVDALLVFFGMTLAEGDEQRLAVEKFIDGAPLDARAEYIQKTFNEGEVQVLADALVREMHKMTFTVDMSDCQFAGNSSGQALKLKLLTMDLLARNKMRRMERGLRERMELFARFAGVRQREFYLDPTQVDIVFTPDLPINEAERVDMVCRLKGLVDDQTLLSQLWFIRDPAEAVQNLQQQAEAEKEGERAGAAKSGNGDGIDRR